MKNSTLLLPVCILALFSCSKKDENSAAVSLGSKDSLYSSVLKEERRLLIYDPAGKNKPYYPQKYPVIYLLDGDSHFASVTTMLDYLSSNQVCPPMIVVAIPNTDRSRDLTPTHSQLLPDGASQDFLKTTGGGEKFTEFIEKELIPYVEGHYPTAPYKVLIGHSFGGLFAINTLIHHPQVFDAYVAIDPSMWWDHRRLLNHADTALRQKDFSRKTLFVSVANTMRSGMDTAHVASDTASASSHIRSILQLVRQVMANPSNGMRVDWKYYDRDDHGSVPLISEYDAIHFIFDDYKLHLNDDQLTAEPIKAHFQKVSKRLGYTVLPPEQLINETGYYFLGQKKWERAFSLFNLNTESYPKSQNAWDSMGDYYSQKGDTAKAIDMYNKSLDLEETAATRKKLEELKKKG